MIVRFGKNEGIKPYLASIVLTPSKITENSLEERLIMKTGRDEKTVEMVPVHGYCLIENKNSN